MSCIAISACDKERQETGTATKGDPFRIKVYDISAISATVEVEPLDKEGSYYMDIINDPDFRQAQENGFDHYLNWLINKLMGDTGKSREDVIGMISSYGNDGFILTSLKAETKYHAFAVGIDKDGKSITEVISKEFTTTALKKSANTFKVSAEDVGSETAVIKVEASSDDPYILAIEPYTVTSDLSDEEVADFIIKENIAWGGLEQMIRTGVHSEEFEGKPDWEYEAVIFGYTDGYATTDVTRFRFRMAEGSAPETCVFDFNHVFGEFDMFLDVTPSENSVVYVSNVISAGDLETLIAAEGSRDAALEETLEMLIEEIISDCGSRARAVDIISSTGLLEYNLKFQPSTDYIQWAVPVSQNGLPAADFSLSGTFTSPAETLSDAALTLSDFRYYNGSELAELYPDAFGDAKGYAVVDMTVKASPAAVKWWSYVALEDLTDRSREVIIKNITSAPTDENLERQSVIAFWGVNTIMGVAQDAQGKYGPLLLEVVDLDKAKALPASEYRF